MKSDTERKRYHTEKLHKRKNRLHVHISKDLRTKLKVKKRSLLVRKGDTVRILRGPEKGKEVKVSRVNVLRRKVFAEGVLARNARGREVGIPLEPSNLVLTGLESTPERKEIFTEEAFRKAPKKEPPKEAPKETPKAAEPKKAEPSGEGHGHEHKPAAHSGGKAEPERKDEKGRSEAVKGEHAHRPASR
jgi:large subunit ribosomal protein L24